MASDELEFFFQTPDGKEVIRITGLTPDDTEKLLRAFGMPTPDNSGNDRVTGWVTGVSRPTPWKWPLDLGWTLFVAACSCFVLAALIESGIGDALVVTGIAIVFGIIVRSAAEDESSSLDED